MVVGITQAGQSISETNLLLIIFTTMLGDYRKTALKREIIQSASIV